MKAKTRKLTTSLIVLALLIWVVSLLASHADATDKSEPTLTVMNSSSSVVGTVTVAADVSNPVTTAPTGLASETDIASDESIPASQTDINSPSPTSTVTPAPDKNTNVKPATPPLPIAQPNTVSGGNAINNDPKASDNNVDQPVSETINDNQLSSPYPTSSIAPPPQSNLKEIVKRAWTFIKKNNYIATSGTTTALLVFVGISLIYDFKLIFWYRKKKKEKKSCKY